MQGLFGLLIRKLDIFLVSNFLRKLKCFGRWDVRAPDKTNTSIKT